MCEIDNRTMRIESMRRDGFIMLGAAKTNSRNDDDVRIVRARWHIKNIENIRENLPERELEPIHSVFCFSFFSPLKRTV